MFASLCARCFYAVLAAGLAAVKGLSIRIGLAVFLTGCFCTTLVFAQPLPGAAAGVDVPAAGSRAVGPADSSGNSATPNTWLLPLVNFIGQQIGNQMNRQSATPDLPGLPGAGLPTSPSSSGLVFSLPVFGNGQGGAALEDDDFETGQLLVLWAGEEATTAGIALLQQRYQLVPSQRHNLENIGLTVVLLILPSDREARQWRDRLRIEQPDWVVDLNARSSPTQAAAPRLYAQKMLNATTPQLSLAAAAIAGVRLGVIDTGIDPALTHPEALNGSVLQLRGLLEPSDKPADSSHGSAVLQLIAGAARQNGFAGAAPPARLFWAAGMRDLNGKAVTNSLLLVRALDWLVGRSVVLINMSLGGKGDAILQAVVARVLGMNVTIVAAAGNNPANNAASSYPAAYPGVWAATAVDAAGQLYSGATRAPYAMLAAPGADIWVPAAGGGNYVSGTSYASALTMATLAWQAQDFWNLSATQRAYQVCRQSKKLPDNTFLGCGLVQKTSTEVNQSAR